MFNSKFNTLLTGLLIVSIIAIIFLIGYFGYSILNKHNIEAGAQNAVGDFQNAVKNNVSTPQESVPDGNIVIGGGDIPTPPTDNQGGSSNASKPKYYGYDVIGTLSIPAIKIEYPILAKSTTNALKVALGYLMGPGVNQPGATWIQGHNYRNGLFFSDLNKLSNGDAIYITDLSGREVKYEIYSCFQADASDTSFVKSDTEGKAEVILSTCTEDYNLRTIVLAREV